MSEQAPAQVEQGKERPLAHAYTPGLRVTTRTRIVKERRLPLKGEVVVKAGEVMRAEDVVARTELPGNVQPVKAASMLGIHQEDLEEYMLKKVGDHVAKDEVIATAKSFFGLFKSHVKAPVDGTVESISTVTGQLIIREAPIPVEVHAYFDGTVTEIIPEEGVVMEAVGAFLQGIFGVGGETSGELALAVQKPDEELTPDKLNESHAGKIVIGGSRIQLPAIDRAKQLGVRAVVVGGIDDADLKQLLGYDLGVAITGHETLGLSLVVTEGFGRMTMASRTFDLLGGHVGRRASVNGATQIRAGVMRPEVIIPTETHLTDVREEEGEVQGLTIGSPIRAIRTPYFGRLGEVTALPPELQKLESEATVRVLEVRFPDGSTAVLPRANVEMIET